MMLSIIQWLNQLLHGLLNGGLVINNDTNACELG